MSKRRPLKIIAGAPDRPLLIADIEIPCYVLEDETRILSQRGMQLAIGMSTGGATGGTGAQRIVKFMASFEKKVYISMIWRRAAPT